MSPMDRVLKEIEDPYLRLVGAKLVNLLDQSREQGPTLEIVTQIDRFAEIVNLPMGAEQMIALYGAGG